MLTPSTMEKHTGARPSRRSACWCVFLHRRNRRTLQPVRLAGQTRLQLLWMRLDVVTLRHIGETIHALNSGDADRSAAARLLHFGRGGICLWCLLCLLDAACLVGIGFGHDAFSLR